MENANAKVAGYGRNPSTSFPWNGKDYFVKDITTNYKFYSKSHSNPLKSSISWKKCSTVQRLIKKCLHGPHILPRATEITIIVGYIFNTYLFWEKCEPQKHLFLSGHTRSGYLRPQLYRILKQAFTCRRSSFWGTLQSRLVSLPTTSSWRAKPLVTPARGEA